MKEPQKIPLNPAVPKTKEVSKVPMPPISHLYDDFGYVLSIENNDTYIPSDLEKLKNEDSKNSY